MSSVVSAFPLRYLPKSITKKDAKKYKKEIEKSRKLYKKKRYYTRKHIKSFKNKKSNHITKAQKLYNVDKIIPNKELSEKTGCSIDGLEKIVSKGRGAYFSSGSRPNQTPESWGLARLASAITSGKSAVVDFKILKSSCKKNSKALRLAKNAVKKYGKTLRKTPKRLL